MVSTQTRNGSVLVLSRKVGETIQIGPNVAITVVKISGGGVRLGIEAPPEMSVVRREIAEQIDDLAELTEEENQALRIFFPTDCE